MSSEQASSFTKCGKVMHCFHIVVTTVWWCLLYVLLWLIGWKKYVVTELSGTAGFFSENTDLGVKMVLLSRKEDCCQSVCLPQFLGIMWLGDPSCILVLFFPLESTGLLFCLSAQAFWGHSVFWGHFSNVHTREIAQRVRVPQGPLGFFRNNPHDDTKSRS